MLGIPVFQTFLLGCVKSFVLLSYLLKIYLTISIGISENCNMRISCMARNCSFFYYFSVWVNDSLPSMFTIIKL